MATRKKRNGGDDFELKELERMEEEERNAKAAALPNNTLLPLTPTSDWRDPSTPIKRARRPAAHGKRFTGGTMTGPSWMQGPKTARVEKGNKVPGAQRGVGQPTIDGFINARKSKPSRKRKK